MQVLVRVDRGLRFVFTDDDSDFESIRYTVYQVRLVGLRVNQRRNRAQRVDFEKRFAADGHVEHVRHLAIAEPLDQDQRGDGLGMEVMDLCLPLVVQGPRGLDKQC